MNTRTPRTRPRNMPRGINGPDLLRPSSWARRTRGRSPGTTSKTRMIFQKRFASCFMALNLNHHSLSLQRGNWGEFVGYPEAPGRSGSPPITSGNGRIGWHGHNSTASPQTDPPILPGASRQPGKTKCQNWNVPAIQLSGAQRRGLFHCSRSPAELANLPPGQADWIKGIMRDQIADEEAMFEADGWITLSSVTEVAVILPNRTQLLEGSAK